MMYIDLIPYITMVLGLIAITTQYNSFVQARDMSNIPYVGLIGMLLVASLTYVYSIHKELPLIPVYANIVVALTLLATKIILKEKNFFNSEEKKCV